jgi:hypothetical protein
MPANESRVVVVGESLVDIISDPRRPEEIQVHPGGSPLNVAVGAARLGLLTSLVTHYADDRYGLVIDEHLRSNSVHVINGGTAPTSTALATLGPDGAADYTFAITWEINKSSLQALAAIQESTHVHAGSIAAVLPPGDQATLALVQAAGGHATVSYDPNCRPGISPDAAAARHQAEFFSQGDIAKASDEDSAGSPDRTPEESPDACWPGPADGPDTRSRRTGHRPEGRVDEATHERADTVALAIFHGGFHRRPRPAGARSLWQTSPARPDPDQLPPLLMPNAPQRSRITAQSAFAELGAGPAINGLGSLVIV